MRAAVAAVVDRAVATRRDLHEHAELSTEEHRTQALIIERLRLLGLDDVRACADTGATAIVRGGKTGPNLLWRADIDGLPLMEETGLPFASRERAMHACGHDGHVAIALGMAEVLARSRDDLAGSVRFAFQPAEEHVGGARRMISDGVMESPKVERAFGLHIWAPLPVGEVRVVAGPVFAASVSNRLGKVSSALVRPASRLNLRSRFQIRSPAASIDSDVQPPSHAASTWGAMSSKVHAKVVNTQSPLESTAAVAS